MAASTALKGFESASEERELAGELRDRVAVQSGLCGTQVGLPAGAGAGDEITAAAWTRRIVAGEPASDDGDFAAALGAVPAAR